MAEVTSRHREAVFEALLWSPQDKGERDWIETGTGYIGRSFNSEVKSDDFEKLAQAIADAEARGAAVAQTESLERWIPCSERQPPTGATVQFASYNGVSVGRRDDEGKWEDLIDVGADCTPNHDYSDEQVTHWAPLLAAPRKTGT